MTCRVSDPPSGPKAFIGPFEALPFFSSCFVHHPSAKAWHHHGAQRGLNGRFSKEILETPLQTLRLPKQGACAWMAGHPVFGVWLLTHC